MKKYFSAFIILFSCNLCLGQWYEQATPAPTFPLFSSSFPSANTGFAVGYGNRMIKTTNGGNNWFSITIFPNTANDLNAVWFKNENTGWMCSTNDTLYHTTNSGVSWSGQMKFPSDGQKIFFINQQTGWILSQPRLYKTTDEGKTWNVIYSQMGQTFTFITPETGWMTTYSSGSSTIHKTTDGGVSWTPQYSTSNFRVIYSLEFVNENTGWAAGYREHILKTTDGGITWIQQRDMNNSTGFFSMDFINANTGWAIGEPGTSVYTINGGETWNQLFLPAGRGIVHFLNSTTGWVVGGRIFKTTSTGLTYRNLNLTSLVEGMYDESVNLLVPDTINVSLRSSVSPYQTIDFAKTNVNPDGSSQLNFINAENGVNYFIAINHRNSLETWSSSAQSFSSNSLSYNFSAAASQAFGNNMKQKGFRWTVFSGDVNQDGTIDLTDLGLIDNDAYNFVSGYINSDLNGDNFSDLSDLGIAENNSFNFIGIIRP